MPKSALRTRMLAIRTNLSAEEQLRAGDRIRSAVIALPEYAAARSVALYAAFNGEVPTSILIRQALASGKEVLLPAVVGQDLVFRAITDEAELVPGRFGILEPHDGCPLHEPGSIDLFVIPGVAFDLNGHRVGYGRGYYDRALHRYESGGKLIGVCYDFQLVEAIAGEPHDVIMDRVITERRVVPPYC